MFLRRTGATPHQLPWVKRCIRHQERTPDIGVDAGLAAERLRDRDLLSRDTRRLAALEEEVAVLGVIPRGGHEQPTGVLDAVRGGDSKNPILRDALPRG